MSIELVREHFKKCNLQDQILEFPASSAEVNRYTTNSGWNDVCKGWQEVT